MGSAGGRTHRLGTRTNGLQAIDLRVEGKKGSPVQVVCSSTAQGKPYIQGIMGLSAVNNKLKVRLWILPYGAICQSSQGAGEHLHSRNSQQLCGSSTVLIRCFPGASSSGCLRVGVPHNCFTHGSFLGQALLFSWYPKLAFWVPDPPFLHPSTAFLASCTCLSLGLCWAISFT